MPKNQKKLKYKEMKTKVRKHIEDKGFDVCLDDDDFCVVSKVENEEEVGDGKDKTPDVEGTYNGRIFKRGLVKIRDDFDSEHSITQYKLFAKRGDLIIGVPKGLKEDFKEVLEENLTPKERQAVKTILEF